MLTELREKSQSFLIYILFGMLIVVFIFFFGLPVEGLQPSGGQTAPTGWAAEVDGEEIPMMQVEMSLRRQMGFGSLDADDDELPRLRRDVLLQIVDQKVVEQRARKMGLGIGEEELNAYIVSDENPDAVLFKGQDGRFDYSRYEAQITQGFGGNTAAYRTMKERELLVQRYLDFLGTQIKVSEAEARDAFERARRSWNLEYLELDPETLTDVPDPSAEEGAGHAKANADAVAKYYEANKSEYDREKEVRVRRILIRVPKDADDAAKAEARKKAEAVLAKAKAPGADFAALAQESSEGYYKQHGGDMGWQAKENTSPPQYAVYSALEEGQVSDIQESAIGFWFVKAEEVKPAVKKALDEVRDEIGLKLLRDERRGKALRAQADQMIARLKAGESLEAVAPQPAAEEPAPVEGEGGEEQAAEAAAEGAEDAAEGEEAVAEDAAEGEEAVAEGATSKPPESPVKTTGPFTDQRPSWARIPGIGESPELARALAGLTAEKPLVETPIEVGGKLMLVRLEERTEPDDALFEKEKADFVRRLRAQRVNALLGQWQAVLFGPVRQREVFRRFSGGALLATLPDANSGEVKINEQAFPIALAEAETPEKKPSPATP